MILRLLVCFIYCIFTTISFAEIKERSIKAESKYLYFPMSAGASSKKFQLIDTVSGKKILDYVGQFDTSGKAPDWVVPVNISAYKNNELKFVMDSPDGKMPILLQGDYPRTNNTFTKMWHVTRPHFHFSPNFGSLGSPLGLVKHNELWHLFYQADPYGINFGKTMLIGHASSKDLINWKELDPAFVPQHTTEGNFSGVSSGSFYADNDNSSGNFKNGKGYIFLTSDENFNVTLYTSTNLEKFEKFKDLKVKGENPRLFRDSESELWGLILHNNKKIEIWLSKDFVEWKKSQEFSDFGKSASLFKMQVTGSGDGIYWVLLSGDGKYFVGDLKNGIFTPQIKDVQPRRAFMGSVDDAIMLTNDPRHIFIGSLRVNNLEEIKQSHQPFVNSLTLPWQLRLVRLSSDEKQLRIFSPKEIDSRISNGENALGQDIGTLYCTSNTITLPDAFGNHFMIAAKLKNNGANILNVEVERFQATKYLTEPIVELKYERKPIGTYPTQTLNYSEIINFWLYVDSFGAELLFDSGDALLFVAGDLRAPQHEIKLGSVGALSTDYIGKFKIRRLSDEERLQRALKRYNRFLKKENK